MREGTGVWTTTFRLRIRDSFLVSPLNSGEVLLTRQAEEACIWTPVAERPTYEKGAPF